eukprot:3831484-Rhodomonas_salina.2
MRSPAARTAQHPHAPTQRWRPPRCVFVPPRARPFQLSSQATNPTSHQTRTNTAPIATRAERKGYGQQQESAAEGTQGTHAAPGVAHANENLAGAGLLHREDRVPGA